MSILEYNSYAEENLDEHTNPSDILPSDDLQFDDLSSPAVSLPTPDEVEELQSLPEDEGVHLL